MYCVIKTCWDESIWWVRPWKNRDWPRNAWLQKQWYWHWRLNTSLTTDAMRDFDTKMRSSDKRTSILNSFDSGFPPWQRILWQEPQSFENQIRFETLHRSGDVKWCLPDRQCDPGLLQRSNKWQAQKNRQRQREDGPARKKEWNQTNQGLGGVPFHQKFSSREVALKQQ